MNESGIDPSKTRLVAHEDKSVLSDPIASFMDDGDDTLHLLNYEQFTALNTHMIQKAHKKIKEQEERIKSLEEQIKNILELKGEN